MVNLPDTIADVLAGDPFRHYVYSYPHKTAYRALQPAVSLSDAWADEDRSALFLYLHVPFCEQRCGFCNLFTRVGANDSTEVDRYLDALTRQAEVVDQALAQRTFARMAIGGGTPTFLSAPQLARLLAIAAKLSADPLRVSTSIETSPQTADDARVAVLRTAGIQRVSMGVQSFAAAETTAVQRRQDAEAADAAARRLVHAGFPVVNLDLMYGLPGQDRDSLCRSIDRAVATGCQELYLYPLYVRPVTGLDRRGTQVDEARLGLYRQARDYLQALGWMQASLRCFRAPHHPGDTGPAYRCQADGMVGIGCGARSYTERLHWSDPFAVSQRGIAGILNAYCARSDANFAQIHHGYHLDEDDCRRRFILLGLLEQGLEDHAYRRRFATAPEDDLPALKQLCEHGLATHADGRWRLTETGLERADSIGAWLFSDRVREHMRAHVPA